MKTIFFGTPDFALPSLQACRDHSDLIAVVTQPDRPRGRGLKLSPCPVRELALQWKLPTFCPVSLRKNSPELEELLSFIEDHRPEVFVVTAYGNILPESFLNKPLRGSINIHASLLPRWRGAAPIQRALEAGDKVSGVCLQQMVFELDAGDVLLEESCLIESDDNAFILSNRLSRMGASLLQKYFLNPPSSGRPQDSNLITHASKILKDEGYWRPDWSASETHNRVRGFAAWPQVKARVRDPNLEIKLLETRLFAHAKSTYAHLSPGQILLEEGRALLKCFVRSGEPASDLGLELLRVQAAGKGPIGAYEFFKNLSPLSGGGLSLEAL